MKSTALIIFGVTYVLLLLLPKMRSYISIASAALFIYLGIVPIYKALQYINWNAILMIAGTMGIVSLFIESKMPDKLADILISRMPNVKWVVVALSLFAGLVSAFVDNVATVLMIAPVAITISKKLNISPIAMIISISVSSNLQGAATLVGDTTSILLAAQADMNFMDFFFYNGRPGLFWIVQIGALLSIVVLLYLFRRDLQHIKIKSETKVEDYFPTVLLLSMISLLILASFMPHKPEISNGFICMSLFIIGSLKYDLKYQNFNTLRTHVKEIDFYTIALLIGLFVLIGGLTEVGMIEDIGKLFVRLSNDNVFVIYTIIVWASVLFSGFVDNIPYVATMLPVTASIASFLAIDPTVLYFGLLIGATLGGNLTPIGASANITGIGILRKEGWNVDTGSFMKIGVPFTLSAVISGYILVWILFGI
ncbi:putative tyrosine transporter P-protein [Alkalibaculum bacchi]|uniref:Putative tyrosine transporter P-protein n=1 Tax=Alkalibaculum bacchi TaxID=645887 RepID=A0A366I1V6_9FIRM|nr:SLC13 family permease [Alkalibaculum bacchi]RBP59968.1 putative tyrosine transporter P-protein [Alkalibaculum bacchi]